MEWPLTFKLSIIYAVVGCCRIVGFWRKITKTTMRRRFHRMGKSQTRFPRKITFVLSEHFYLLTILKSKQRKAFFSLEPIKEKSCCSINRSPLPTMVVFCKLWNLNSLLTDRQTILKIPDSRIIVSRTYHESSRGWPFIVCHLLYSEGKSSYCIR